MTKRFTPVFIRLLILLPLLAGIFTISFGQNQRPACQSGEHYQKLLKEHPEIRQQIDANEAFTQEWVKEYFSNGGEHAGLMINIPVVVHIVWQHNDENISDEQVQSQFDVLNEDFNKMNANWESTPAPFKDLVADIGIQFCLATVDPQGNPTNGITRTQTSIDMIGETPNFYKTANGGHDPWDNSKYVNVWLANQEDGSLGFATFPGTAMPPESDGIVIPSKFWGTKGTAANSAPNHLGKTATHEFGHYFNLHHVWGPSMASCSEDDEVADTPLQYTESSGCPTFPMTDQCTASGNGLMFMNFMDYADDACMTMFSEGQKARMLAAVNGPRASLMNSNSCDNMTAVSDLSRNTIRVFPNPAATGLSLELPDAMDVHVEIIDLKGQLMLSQEWSSEKIRTLDIRTWPNGMYLVKVSNAQFEHVQKLVVTK